MKILSKALLLVFLLLFPLLFYLFLQFFGENRYALPIYYQDRINKELPNIDFQDNQYTFPDFSLKDLHGSVQDQSSLEGRITLVCFVNSTNTFAMIFDDLLKISQAFKGEKKLQLFMIASEEDSLGRAFLSFQPYLTANHPWLFLQGSSQAVTDLARCSGMREVDMHRPFLIVVDSLKRIRGYYTTWGEEKIKQLKTELYILISNSVEQ